MTKWIQWHIAEEQRLRELADQGLTGQDIASHLSSEFGRVFTANSVFHKANRLGISITGRAGASESLSQDDPFAMPSWLQRELEKAEEPEHMRPFKAVMLGFDEELSSSEIRKRVQVNYEELWTDYVSDVLRNGLATEEQAEHALKQVPRWFHIWARVPVIRAWQPDISIKSKQTEKSIDPKQPDVEPNNEDPKVLHFPLAAESFITQQRSQVNSSGLVGSPPRERCERCGGSPVFNNILEEWECSKCGHILRL